MKNVRLASTLVAAVIGVSGAVLAQAPKTLNVTALKSQVKSKVPSALEEAIRDLKAIKVAPPCQAEFDAAVREAQAEAQACLNIDNPPPGSPFDTFNKKNAAGQQVFCDDAERTHPGKTCGDVLIADQQRFCAINAAKAKARAKSIEARCLACEQKKKELADLKARIATLEREVAACNK